MKAWLVSKAKTFVLFVVVLGIGGLVVAVSGVMPIKASSGHWPITAWFLNFSMERSVKTHTLGMKAPPLDDASLVLRGAGHYETACKACHGSPTLKQPRIGRAMTPHPPDLRFMIPQWDAEELFYITKHGVKFTGMPAWPSQERDDEVWSMVAFLKIYPSLNADAYEELVFGSEQTPLSSKQTEAAPIEVLAESSSKGSVLAASCVRCHGNDGNGRGNAAFPKLAGQSSDYLEAALEAYTTSERPSGIMEPVAAGLTAAQRRDLADYYSALEPRPFEGSTSSTSIDVIEHGEKIATRGVPERRIPACVACHGPREGPRNAHFPQLEGQYAAYLVQQLKLFRNGHRGGSPYARLMEPVAHRLTDVEMHAVAHFYQSLVSDTASQ